MRVQRRELGEVRDLAGPAHIRGSGEQRILNQWTQECGGGEAQRVAFERAVKLTPRHPARWLMPDQSELRRFPGHGLQPITRTIRRIWRIEREWRIRTDVDLLGEA